MRIWQLEGAAAQCSWVVAGLLPVMFELSLIEEKAMVKFALLSL